MLGSGCQDDDESSNGEQPTELYEWSADHIQAEVRHQMQQDGQHYAAARIVVEPGRQNRQCYTAEK
jgi:hypothetical protein